MTAVLKQAGYTDVSNTGSLGARKQQNIID
jgi:hypothetical protein